MNVTSGLSIDEIRANAGGYLGQGFRYATSEEVGSLFASTGLRLPNQPSQDFVATLMMIQFLGPTGPQEPWLVPYSGLGIVAGMYESGPGTPRGVVDYVYAGNNCTQSVPATGMCATWEDGEPRYLADRGYENVGHYLVRPHAVPEPDTFALVLMGVALALLSRRQKDQLLRETGGAKIIT